MIGIRKVKNYPTDDQEELTKMDRHLRGLFRHNIPYTFSVRQFFEMIEGIRVTKTKYVIVWFDSNVF